MSKEKKTELKMVDVSQGNTKDQVENVVREVMYKYHFLTFTEYKAVLTKFNIAAEEVKGSHSGSPFSGVVYCQQIYPVLLKMDCQLCCHRYRWRSKRHH